jgi:phosphoribosylformylglycinamidine (FGAM) synthase PurS component
MCEKLLANPLVEDYEIQLLDGMAADAEAPR